MNKKPCAKCGKKVKKANSGVKVTPKPASKDTLLSPVTKAPPIRMSTPNKKK